MADLRRIVTIHADGMPLTEFLELNHAIERLYPEAMMSNTLAGGYLVSALPVPAATMTRWRRAQARRTVAANARRRSS